MFFSGGRYSYRSLGLPLRITNSNRCISTGHKNLAGRRGRNWHLPPPLRSQFTLPAGDYPAFNTFLGSEPDTHAVGSHTYWGAVTCATFDQERSTGQQGLLVVGAPPPHRHLAPVESGLCSPLLSLPPERETPRLQGGSCPHGVVVVCIAEYFCHYKLRGT